MWPAWEQGRKTVAFILEFIGTVVAGINYIWRTNNSYDKEQIKRYRAFKRENRKEME
jgi:hypothetical protein